MNETAAAVGNAAASVTADSTDTITTVHLILMALFAALVIAGIVYGARLKRSRVAAEEQIEQHAADAGVGTEPAAPSSPELPADRTSSPAEPQARAHPAPEPRPEAAPPERPVADEPIAAAAPLEASPATEAASAPDPAPAPSNEQSPTQNPAQGSVTQLKGLGPKVAARLAELGITTVGQVAALTDDQADALDAQLGAFRGRMGRDRWIEQARFLAAGDRAGFEAVFGRL